MMVNGGELVVRTLLKAGVKHIFGLHGAHIDPVFQAALDLGLQIVDCRSEATAGHAAEGTARASRGLGVALVTAGGGFTNVLTPIANAYSDRTPLLVLTGSGMIREAETNTLQAGIDQVAVAAPMTKWAHRILRTEQIPRLLAQAIRIALSPPCGPVLIDLPWDILMGAIEGDGVDDVDFRSGFGRAAPPPQALEKAFDLLDQAQRPIVVVGSEASRGMSDEALARFATRAGLPVFSDYEGYAALSQVKRGHGGLLQALYFFRKLGEAPDAILLLGTRFGLNTLHGSGLLLPHSAKIVQVDPDAREFGRLQPVTQSLQADVSTTIEAMADAADGRVWKDRGAWLDRVDELVRRKHDTIAQTGNAADGFHPLEAVQTVARHVDGSTLLVADGALSYLWLSEIVSLARPKAFLCHGYLGCMGVGFGTAIGAQKTLSPGERAILVTGDGAVGYALADFDTLVRHHVPLIVVIMNNQSWGATQHFQKLLLGENRISGTMLQNGRYHEAAASFGVDAYYAENAAEFEAALTAALAKQVPACINVRVALAPIPPEEMLLLGLEESGGGIGNSANTA